MCEILESTSGESAGDLIHLHYARSAEPKVLMTMLIGRFNCLARRYWLLHFFSFRKRQTKVGCLCGAFEIILSTPGEGGVGGGGKKI
jgi:hypothetical protein